uniref:E3 ubiquitin-protein ligase TRIM21-like n=1 Tax=Seriola dumerili TaxID=41447 RepID=A0A3B4U9K9_SERDU
MSAANCLLSEESFLCSICLDVFNTPVTLQCGHNFCRSCITQNWRINRKYQCPVCKKHFDTREVPCDMCTGVKLKALKSCLVICTKHNELLELFCKTEQMCVCQFCNESDHETHDVVPLSEECEVRKTDLERTQAGFQQMIQERELKIQELRRSAEISMAAADKETADGVHVFSDLMQFAETGLAELSEQIKKKQKMTAKSAEGFIKDEAQQLSCSDHFHLLQNFSSLNAFPNTKDWNKVSIHQPSFEGAVARAVAQLRETLNKVTTKLLESELKRVQQCAVDVTLDPNTAHPRLILSDDGKQVNHSDVEKNLPDNPERFSYCVMVLGKQSFSSGRFYYEVEVKGKTKWDLGVTSVSANRKGQVTSSPKAGYWTLQLRNGNEYVALADPDVVLSLKSQPQKVGVFVDYEEGLVSFYNVDVADIIYSFTGCSFPNKLLPFFSPCFNDGGNNSAPLRISIVQLN